jgi:undecaprenyl-diphosphatase
VSDGPPAAAGSPEGGPLGEDQGREPGRAPSAVARPPAQAARELGLATGTVVVGFGILTACLVVFGSLARDIRARDVFIMDAWATPFLHGMASPAMDAVMNAFTTVGTIFVILPAFLIIGAWLVRTGHVRSVAFLVVAMLGSFVLQLVLKPLFARPRPDVAYAALVSDYSFPSGHTLNAVVFYGAVALVMWSLFGRRAGLASVAVAAIIALAVGVSRIYLGYHFLTDVVGAMLAGIAWLLIAAAAFRARPTWRRWRGRGTPARRSAGPGAMVPR